MGEDILCFYRKRITKSMKVAFVATFIIGLLTHIYKFTNTLLNHDSVINYYADQNIVGSGRWFLSIACGVSSFFDLPWIIGLLSLVYIALTAVIIVNLFRIENSVAIILVGGVLASSVGITETFFFGFTADGYMLSMLLATLAVQFSTFGRNRWYHWLISAGMLCLSCAIYQSYVSFAFLLMAFYFVVEMLKGQRTTAEALRYVGKQAAIFVGGLLVYYIIWKICMAVQDVNANHYQGINDLATMNFGSFNFGAWLAGCIDGVHSIFIYFFEWNILANKVNLYAVINIIFFVLLGVTLVVTIKRSEIYKNKVNTLLVVLALLLCIPGTICWKLLTPDVQYRPMMLVCLTLLFVLTIVLCEGWGRKILKNLLLITLCVSIWNSAVMANAAYFYLQRSFYTSQEMGTEIVAQIRRIDDEAEFTKVALVGSRYEESADLTVTDANSSKIFLLARCLEKDLLLDGYHAQLFITGTLNPNYSFLSEDEIRVLQEMEEIQSLPIWPADDCFTIVDDTLVIKLGLCPQ